MEMKFLGPFQWLMNERLWSVGVGEKLGTTSVNNKGVRVGEKSGTTGV